MSSALSLTRDEEKTDRIDAGDVAYSFELHGLRYFFIRSLSRPSSKVRDAISKFRLV